MSRARDAKRQRRLLARTRFVLEATWEEALAEYERRAYRDNWLRSPHPFWPKRRRRMAGK